MPRIIAIIGSNEIGMWIYGKVEYMDLRMNEILGGFFFPELLASH